ncbi:MAG: rod shape-determining protein MreC [Saprospiraceae bacterium]
MRNLLLLFIRNGGFVTFVLVEVFCFYLIVSFNSKQNSILSFTANTVGGAVLKKRQSVAQYFNLAERADSLSADNARLQTEIYKLKNEQQARQDTLEISLKDSLKQYITRPHYEFIAARVISNSISNKSNWVMLDRGSAEGIETNMGVATTNGLIGIVRHVSPHYCLAMSLLHPQTKISAKLSKSGAFGSLSWDGKDPRVMTLHDIPKHIQITPGEAIYTSGYSLLFPKDILIGYSGKPSLKDGSNFYTIPVRLSADPATFTDAYIVKNIFYSELAALKDSSSNEQ